MKVRMNGIVIQKDGPLRNEEFLEYIEQTFPDSLSEALRMKFQSVINETEWYKYEHPNFDFVKNSEQVKNICGDDLDCYMDSINWTIMNKTDLTSNIYKFITHRVNVVKEGFENNFWPNQLNWETFSENWDLVLDCILFF